MVATCRYIIYRYLPIMSDVTCMHGLFYRCIPYRITEDDDQDSNSSSSNTRMENKIQVLMVSSPDRDDKVFPKVHLDLMNMFQQ